MGAETVGAGGVGAGLQAVGHAPSTDKVGLHDVHGRHSFSRVQYMAG